MILVERNRSLRWRSSSSRELDSSWQSSQEDLHGSTIVKRRSSKLEFGGEDGGDPRGECLLTVHCTGMELRGESDSREMEE